MVVIEHNLEVIKTADWIIDMGPEGGDGGGRIVVAGTPEDVAACPASYTGRYLKDLLAGVLPEPGKRQVPEARNGKMPGAGNPRMLRAPLPRNPPATASKGRRSKRSPVPVLTGRGLG